MNELIMGAIIVGAAMGAIALVALLALRILLIRRIAPPSCDGRRLIKAKLLPSPHGIDPGEPRGMWKYYQTSPQRCVTKVTQCRLVTAQA